LLSHLLFSIIATPSPVTLIFHRRHHPSPPVTAYTL
jgi:hypothetical protein